MIADIQREAVSADICIPLPTRAEFKTETWAAPGGGRPQGCPDIVFFKNFLLMLAGSIYTEERAKLLDAISGFELMVREKNDEFKG